MKKSIIKQFIGLILFIFLWELFAQIIAKYNIFPSALNTFKNCYILLMSDYVVEAIFLTLSRTIIAFVLSYFIAFILAFISANFKTFKLIINPFIVILKSLPSAAIIYLFLLLVGYKLAPIFLVFIVCFPIIYETILKAIKCVPEEFIAASKIDGANNFNINLRIIFPLIIKDLFLAINNSLILGLKIEIMAEVITSYSKNGIGSLIASNMRFDPINMLPVFSYSLIAILLAIFIDNLVLILIHKISIEL